MSSQSPQRTGLPRIPSPLQGRPRRGERRPAPPPTAGIEGQRDAPRATATPIPPQSLRNGDRDSAPQPRPPGPTDDPDALWKALDARSLDVIPCTQIVRPGRSGFYFFCCLPNYGNDGKCFNSGTEGFFEARHCHRHLRCCCARRLTAAGALVGSLRRDLEGERRRRRDAEGQLTGLRKAQVPLC